MQGWTYAVTVAGNASGFWSPSLNIGDLVIANVDNPTSIADWTEVQANVDVATAGTAGTAVNGIAGFNEDDFTAVNGFVSVKDGAYVTGSGTANQVALWDGTSNITSDGGLTFDTAANHLTIGGDLNVLGGDIVLSGTGRIQGIDTVTNGTDAANKTYVDTLVAGTPQGTVVSITAGTGLSSTPSPITATGTINIADNGVGATQLNVSGNGAITEFLRSDSDGSFTWAVPPGTYSLPVATNTVLGGIELFSNTDNPTAANSVSSTANRTYGLQLNSSNQGVINVPWTDTNTVPNNATITLGALTGISGGGNFTTDQSANETINFALDFGELTVGGTLAGGDYLIAENGGVENRQLISSIPLSIFNNNSGWTTNTGTVTSIAAGTGLTGGTITGTGTISIPNRGVDTAQLATDSVVYSRLGPEFTETDGSAATSIKFWCLCSIYKSIKCREL